MKTAQNAVHAFLWIALASMCVLAISLSVAEPNAAAQPSPDGTATPEPTPTSIFDTQPPEPTPTSLFIPPTPIPTPTPLFPVGPTAIPEPTAPPTPTVNPTATPRPRTPRPAQPAAPDPTATPEPTPTEEPAAITAEQLAESLTCQTVTLGDTPTTIRIPTDVAAAVDGDVELEVTVDSIANAATMSDAGRIDFELPSDIEPGTYELTLTGSLVDGEDFEAQCSLVVEAGAEQADEEPEQEPEPTTTPEPAAPTSEPDPTPRPEPTEPAERPTATGSDESTSGGSTIETEPVPGGPNRSLMAIVGVGMIVAVLGVSATRYLHSRSPLR